MSHSALVKMWQICPLWQSMPPRQRVFKIFSKLKIKWKSGLVLLQNMFFAFFISKLFYKICQTEDICSPLLKPLNNGYNSNASTETKEKERAANLLESQKTPTQTATVCLVCLSEQKQVVCNIVLQSVALCVAALFLSGPWGSLSRNSLTGQLLPIDFL